MKPYISSQTLHDIRGRRQGQAFPLLKLHRKSHHQPPSFSTWTTLYCSPSGQCLLVPQPWAGLHSQWELEERLKETEREEENGEHEPAEETQLRHQAESCLHLLIRCLSSLTEVRYFFISEIRFFIKLMWKFFFMLWQHIQTAETWDFSSHHKWVKEI